MEETSSTITLVKVDHGDRDIRSSVVGGFSSVSWAQTNAHQGYYVSQGHAYYFYEMRSPGAFIFTVKDGFAQSEDEFQPVVWELPEGPEAHPMARCGSTLGPDFGVGGFRLEFDCQGRNFCMFFLGDENVSTSPFWFLHGRTVSEIEVYSVCDKVSVLASVDVSSAMGEGTTDRTPDYSIAIDACQIDNTHLFGASIAGALMEEGVALHDAQIELALVGKKVTAAACALTAIYGPDSATGKPDPVVELNVRGTRMTTLRSTLQVCPYSALATRFDDSKWPSDGEHFGVIDCSPSIFSKVLDVLRMRKRAKWPKRDAQRKVTEVQVTRVMIAAGDRASFKEFVDVYFSGYQAFVMNRVTFEGS